MVRLDWRETRAEDLVSGWKLSPADAGAGIIGWDEAMQVWLKLLKTNRIQSAVVEAESAGKREIALFGASVFVRSEFVKKEMTELRPGLNDRIAAHEASGRSVVLTEEEIAAGNARQGIWNVILSGSADHLADPQMRGRVLTQSAESYVQLHVGYQIMGVLEEVTGEQNVAIRRATGFHRMLREFGADHVFTTFDAETARRVPGSVVNRIFDYRHPTLRLSSTERSMLRAALPGLTDRELVRRIGGKPDTHKSQWRSIFAKVELYKPEIFGPADQAPEEGLRGNQRRHHLLGYLRRHMEELRPYDWSQE